MSDRIRVMLADDHALVLEGMRCLIEQFPEFDLIATAQDGDELLCLLDRHSADVVVLDLHMPYHGLKVLAEIRRRALPVSVLVLTAYGEGESLHAALELGVEGFALKTEPPAQTLETIRQLARGHLVFPRAMQNWLVTRRVPAPAPSHSEISPRESEILLYLAQGNTNSEIAAALRLKESTIRFHLKNIFSKLGVTNRTEAVVWHFQRGIEKPYS